jgi:uncharacterized protein
MTGWILRVVLFLIVLRLVLRFVMGLVQGLSGPASGSRSARPPSQPLVRDPVCGTYVPRSSALTARSGGATLYFCSEHCREAYGKHA